MRPFFRGVKVFNKKSRPKDELLGVRAGGRGRNGTKRMMKILAFAKIFAVKI